jgi:hypothetical protein
MMLLLQVWIKRCGFLAASLGTRSLLVVPVILGDDVLGLVGLHTTRTPRDWLDDEVSFLQSIAGQIAVGYEYTRLYSDKEREAETKRALLSIANALNAGPIFARYRRSCWKERLRWSAQITRTRRTRSCRGRISLAAFKAAPHASIEQVQGLFDQHGQSLDVTAFPAMVEVLAQGKTLRLLETDLPFLFDCCSIRFSVDGPRWLLP